jgi:hypothetical protein
VVKYGHSGAADSGPASFSRRPESLRISKEKAAHRREGEKTMPLVTIKVFEDELSDSQAKDLIHLASKTFAQFRQGSEPSTATSQAGESEKP